MPAGSSVTSGCSEGTVFRFDRKIVVVDTPGIFDTKHSNREIKEEISKCIGFTSPGPHAFILVVSLAVRFTEEEKRSVDHFLNQFGENIYNYFIILFTRIDELEKHKRTLKDHLKKAPPALIQFIKKCGGRYYSFNNDLQDDEQVRLLLDGIKRNVEKNDGNHYTSEMYKKAEEQIRKIENEKLLKEKEERERDYQKITNEIENKYKTKIDQGTKDLQDIQTKLRSLTKRHEDSKREMILMNDQREEKLKKEIQELEAKYEKEIQIKMSEKEGKMNDLLVKLEKQDESTKQIEQKSNRQKEKLELEIKNLKSEHERMINLKKKESDDRYTELKSTLEDEIKRNNKEIAKKKREEKKYKKKIRRMEETRAKNITTVKEKLMEALRNFEMDLRDKIRQEMEKNNLTWLGKGW